MTFTQFLLVLKARRVLAISILGTCIILAVVIALILPNQYTATASVLVDLRAAPDSSGMAAPMTTATYMATQVDIVSSPRVAQRAATILKLEQLPQYKQDWKDDTGGRGDIDQWIGTLLLKKVTVTPSRDSNVIDIAATVPDVKFAAVLANAFAQAYIDTLIELKVDAAKRYAMMFDERSKELRLDVEAKQQKLADYERRTGIVPSPTDGRLDIENQRLAQLISQLAAVQAQRQDSQSRQRQLSGDYDSLPEVLQSPVIGGLKSDLGKAESKLAEIAQNSGKNYPDYQATAEEIASLKERIRQESARIAASLNATTQINVRRESEIQDAIAAQKKRMQEMTNQNDEASVLQNDVVSAQRNLDAVTQRLAQTSLEGATQQTNVSLLTPAVEPLHRSSPRRTAIFLVGAFVGVLLGCISAVVRELIDRRVRQNEELLQLLGVPLLASVKRARMSRRGDEPGSSPRLAGQEAPTV